jgi:hypothetical protein
LTPPRRSSSHSAASKAENIGDAAFSTTRYDAGSVCAAQANSRNGAAEFTSPTNR